MASELAPSLAGFELEAHLPPFLYDPLSADQIRLLTIAPRLKNEIVHCSLETFEADRCPEYEALSYAWGDMNDKKCIAVNGKSLKISHNLWDFLDVVSKGNLMECWHPAEIGAFATTYLWIDQLCIDQSSVQEKNHQVQRMALIFRGAVQVLTWLGRYTNENQDALLKLANYGSMIYSFGNLSLQPDEIEALRSLLSCSYWTRLWIVQEVVLAKDVLICFGVHVLNWNTFDLAINNLVRSKILADSAIGNWPLAVNRQNMMELLAQRWNSRARRGTCAWNTDDQPLGEVLEAFSSLSCQDPRDKIYGLLALAKGTRIQVDYAKPAATIFWEAATDFLQATYFHAKWLVPLGQAMGVTGHETDAFTFELCQQSLWSTDHVTGRSRVKLKWPDGFAEISSLGKRGTTLRAIDRNGRAIPGSEFVFEKDVDNFVHRHFAV